MTDFTVDVEIPKDEILASLDERDWSDFVAAIAERTLRQIKDRALADVHASQDYRSAAFLQGQIADLKALRQALKDEVAALRDEKRGLVDGSA